MHWITLTVLLAATTAPVYKDQSNLLVYQDDAGNLKPVTSVDDWEIRRRHLIENFQKVAGAIPPSPHDASFHVEEHKSEDMGGHTRKTISFTTEPGDRLWAYLLIPKGISEPRPGLLCPHPTSAQGKGAVVGLGEPYYRNYGGELADRGYVVLAPDYPGFGDTKPDVYAMGYVSNTAKGIFNHMRCIDLLQSLPEVDPKRIGSIGHSLGGHNTLFVGLFDPRVKVMVTSCGFCSFAKYYGGDLTGWSHKGYMPRIAEVYGKDPAQMPFDFTELLGALAPRPVFINAPLRDENFDAEGVRDCVRAATPIYELYGAGDALVAVHPDCEHDFPEEVREQAFQFVDRALDFTPPR